MTWAQMNGGQWRREADVVVIGSGAAGISVALTAAARGRQVLVVTKDLVGGATPLAQGGLAAALGAGDTPAAHVSDTLIAGAGLCEPDIVAALADGAPGAIGWLSGLGARLETRDLRLEGGHSARRIVHSGDDATGAEVHRTLLAALLASGIEILDRTVALDLLLSDAERSVTGLAAAFIGADGGLTPGVISARAVVIAAGGLGQAFGTTTNPAGATGDGIAIAARAGAVIRDLEFVQFHPTVLWLPGASGQCPLITEALRGAGAVLRDAGGTPLMAGHDPRGDLAPRDVIAARMAEVIAAGHSGHVWLDATFLGRELLENGFPTVTAACRKHGIDPVTDMIPVAPGAHYSCGGIRADLDGRTSLAGLYAAGEAASTGVQGANRLASNSVTEAIIAGRRTGAAVAATLPGTEWPAGAVRQQSSGLGAPRASEVVALGHTGPADSGPVAHKGASSGLGAPAASGFWPDVPQGQNGATVDGGRSTGAGTGAERRGLAAAMSRYAGVMRDGEGLTRLLELIAETGTSCSLGPARAFEDAGAESLGLESVEAANLRAVSVLIAVGARRRAESRGCHRRRDAAGTAAAPWHTLVRWDGHKLAVTKEEL
jgi:L-aspartate oxidase